MLFINIYFPQNTCVYSYIALETLFTKKEKKWTAIIWKHGLSSYFSILFQKHFVEQDKKTYTKKS